MLCSRADLTGGGVRSAWSPSGRDGGWTRCVGHDQLSASLAHFAGIQAYGVETLRDDLARFAFLLGGNDGEHLFLRSDAPNPQAGGQRVTDS